MDLEQMMLPILDESSPNILKRDVVTRWTSTFEMLKSFKGQCGNVNIWLSYLRRSELEILPEEETFLADLVQFFEIFMKVTKILESSQSTINLALVMYVDILHDLESHASCFNESDSRFTMELKQMYDVTLDNLKKRYPISDEILCASLLDPTFQSLTIVKNLLDEKKTTKARFLKNMYSKYVGELPVHTGSIARCDSNSIREKLASKHGLVSQTVGFEREVSAFESVTHQVEDLLQWYKSVGVVQFPLLSKLARIILQLSATSGTIERLNSRAGRVITFERTNLSNNKTKKLLIVQFNLPVLEKLENN